MNKNFIENLILIYENKQLADKLYFNTKVLNSNDKDVIYSITNGGETTKIICDFYLEMSKYKNVDINKLKLLNSYILNYNKNTLPIKDFDLYNKSNISYSTLITRNEIIEKLKKLPSTAVRNLKNDLRVPRTNGQLGHYLHLLDYFMSGISSLNNRNEDTVKKILKKVYKNNVTMEDLVNFVEDKENLLGGDDFTKEKILKIVEEEDLLVVFDNNNILVVKVDSVQGMKAIGCNSLWCFTYGENNYNDWYKNSYNDIVYTIIDFSEKSDSEDFMHVYIRPLPIDYEYDNEDGDDYSPVYNMSNENHHNPLNILEKIGDNFREIMDFDEEPEEEEVFEFSNSVLKDLLNKHKLQYGFDYKIDKGQILKILKGVPNDEEPKYYINIDGKNGNVSLDRLLSLITNYQIFN